MTGEPRVAQEYLVWCPEKAGTEETAEKIVAFSADWAAWEWLDEHPNLPPGSAPEELMVRGPSGALYEVAVDTEVEIRYSCHATRVFSDE